MSAITYMCNLKNKPNKYNQKKQAHRCGTQTSGYQWKREVGKGMTGVVD